MDTYISTLLRGAMRYVKFTAHEQSETSFEANFIQIFISRAFAAHGIICEEDICIDFLDNNGAPIYQTELFGIVGQKMNCGCFFIELKISGESNKTITAAQLRVFLVKKNCQFIINQEQRTGKLEKKNRMKLIDCLSALIDEEYAGSATVVEIKSICEAAIEICPSMKGPSGGIELLYGTNCGYLYDKLRNKSRKLNQFVQPEMAICEAEGTPSTEEYESDLITFFKNCVVRNEADKLQEKLRTTVETRRQLLLHPPKPIHDIFGFYFVDPQYILYDFDLLFEHIDSASLISTWPTIKNKPYEKYNVRLDTDIEVPQCDSDLLCCLRLLKLLPAPRIKFENSLKSFIKFSEDPNIDPTSLLEPRNPHPIIIAAIININTIDKKFYIGYENRIISLTDQFCRLFDKLQANCSENSTNSI